MKLADLIVSAILKRGILSEVRNMDLDFEVPVSTEEGTEKKMLVKMKIEHITVRIDKE